MRWQLPVDITCGGLCWPCGLTNHRLSFLCQWRRWTPTMSPSARSVTHSDMMLCRRRSDEWCHCEMLMSSQVIDLEWVWRTLRPSLPWWKSRQISKLSVLLLTVEWRLWSSCQLLDWHNLDDWEVCYVCSMHGKQRTVKSCFGKLTADVTVKTS